ncbi:MAG: pilus assembly FimT family protein [Candidatus Sumerlaeaceae bacterium]|jgi:prepilin-type N-terminal cleavage/methylation domain-containing protein
MQRNKVHRRGFTLIELIVVIAIMTLLSLVSVNAYISLTAARRARAGAEMLASTLAAARSDAISQQVPFRVVIQRLDPLTNTPRPAFWIDEIDPSVPTTTLYPTATQLATGVRRQQVRGVISPPEGTVVSSVIVGTTSTMTAPPNPAYALVVFSPSGASNYASIQVEDTRARDASIRTASVTVYPATGRASVQGGGL